MEVVKRKRRCEPDCRDHLFLFHTLSGKPSKHDAKIVMCPKFQREPQPPQMNYPTYNPDNRYYTQAFILGSDKRSLAKNEQQELMDHQKLVRESFEKQNQFGFPRPNSKNINCSVCKEPYRNYYMHIFSDEHRARISVNLYNEHIRQLLQPYAYLWAGSQEKADLAEKEDYHYATGQPEEQPSQQPSQQLSQQASQERSEQPSDNMLINPLASQVPLSEPEDQVKEPQETKQKSFNQFGKVSLKRSPMPFYQQEPLKKKVSLSSGEAIIKIKRKEELYPEPEKLRSLLDFERVKRQEIELRTAEAERIAKEKTREIQMKEVKEQHLEERSCAPTEKIVNREFIWQKEDRQKNLPAYHLDRPNDYYSREKDRAGKLHESWESGVVDKESKFAGKPFERSLDEAFEKGYQKKGYEKYKNYEDYDKKVHYDKEKEKYDYNAMYCQQQWPYPPYYMPTMMPPPPLPERKGYMPPGNTSININFPLYMPYPQSPHSLSMGYGMQHNPYPMMPPYMGYQYPYMPGQSPRKKNDYHSKRN